MPVRNPLKRRGRFRVNGYYCCYTARCALLWESQIEGDFLVKLDLDPDVIDIEVQPFTITYHDESRRRKYTPDMLVTRRDGQMVR